MSLDSPGMVIDEKQTESMDEEAEPTANEESVAAVPTRGVARRNVRRARGRRGGAAGRARVVSTRIHGGRRNAILPATTNNEENNTTLEEQ